MGKTQATENSEWLEQLRDLLFHITRRSEVVQLQCCLIQHLDNIIKSLNSSALPFWSCWLASSWQKKKKKKRKNNNKKVAVAVQVSHLHSPLSEHKKGDFCLYFFKELRDLFQKPPPPTSLMCPWPNPLLLKPIAGKEWNSLHWLSVTKLQRLRLGMGSAFPKAHGALGKCGY